MGRQIAGHTRPRDQMVVRRNDADRINLKHADLSDEREGMIGQPLGRIQPAGTAEQEGARLIAAERYRCRTVSSEQPCRLLPSQSLI